VLADAYERTGSMEVLKRAAMVLADAMDPEMAGPEEGKEGKGRDQMAEKGAEDAMVQEAVMRDESS
jgi:hypothetical protein